MKQEVCHITPKLPPSYANSKKKNHINFRATEFWCSLSVNNLINQPLSLDFQNNEWTWIKSLSSWRKLNVDGSTKINLLAADGVIRSNKSEWKIGFSEFINIGKTELAEAWSLLLGHEIVVFIIIQIFKIPITKKLVCRSIGHRCKKNSTPSANIQWSTTFCLQHLYAKTTEVILFCLLVVCYSYCWTFLFGYVMFLNSETYRQQNCNSSFLI